MGHFSDLMIEEAEQRLRLDGIEGVMVCRDCFTDRHLAKVVEDHATGHACDYCKNEGEEVVAGPLTAVLEHMLPQIELEYASADQSLPNDPETKEPLFPEDAFDARELLELYIGLELPNDYKGELIEDIAGALPEQDWCLIDPLRSRHEEMIANSWDQFKSIVQHRRRFFFLQHKDKDLTNDLDWGEAAYDIPELLDRIAAFATDHGMIRRLAAGSRWLRVQELGEGEQNFGPRRIGPPPYEHANMPNRMSPAGIPMFYGAVDAETALAEVAETAGRYAVGTFETLKDVVILYVREAPEVPSLFDEARAGERSIATFMQSFIDDFRAPIDRKRRPHVDYLPTQVVTEYFRTSVDADDDTPILGILYSSTRNGQDAIVLFAEDRDVVDGPPDGEPQNDEWLRMVDYVEVEQIPAEQPQEAAAASAE